MLQGSAAEYVVRTGRPLLVERVRGFDFWGYNDLVALARPVRWYGRLAKVLLLVLRYDDRHLLEAQLTDPAADVRSESYQII
ncbi:hypothetical protein HRbin23_01474 [bacterium HR23]|uniref:Uncharacterized protein n=1 Tax=uncultured prokaryote TaxID=198431 RepID=H5SLC7_9ZZZZ|nr:hypothetical protein HGMM_F46A05C02 [uncultured prokaryote]GBD11795.1 hypothetical protein HRbin23_01474 [bacterium HR23]